MREVGIRYFPTFTSLGIIIVFLFALVLPITAQEAKVSKFGEYRGYSKEIYTEYVRISQYVKVRDGTKLAVDIFRPTINGVPESKPLPVVWTHTRYTRARIIDGKMWTQLSETPWGSYEKTLVKHGYIVGAVDVRGGGASFGVRHGEFNRPEAYDAYDVTEWFAAQPWCDGRIGMFGQSYLGITQYFAASTCPPHLVAIFPEKTATDFYDFVYGGGVYKIDFMEKWGSMTKMLDTLPGVVKVDKDTDGSLLKKALAEHQGNSWIHEMVSALPYRDSWHAPSNESYWVVSSPMSYWENIQDSKVAIYHWAGWFDPWPKDQMVLFKNLKNPQKIVLGAWPHFPPGPDKLLMIEHLRWFDYWLKGIENGIMKEPPIAYTVMGAPETKKWHFSERWPLKNEQTTNYYFREGKSNSVSSQNDGRLITEPPKSLDAKDEYTIDYTTTTGSKNRWTNSYGADFDYPDMAENDRKGLTYTTPPLAQDVELTGHPVVHLWIASTAKDVDFFVYLEEVDIQGISTYLTEGTLRASHRSIRKPHYNYLGLPYHRSFRQDIADLPDHPVELVFDLIPTSNIFDKNHRIRVTITCADAYNFSTPKLDPPPTIAVYREKKHSSYITLPVISGEK